MSKLLTLIAPRVAGLQSTSRAFGSSLIGLQKGIAGIEREEVEAADPFLSKLQQQTEASYLELLSRKDQVPHTEDDQLAEEDEEVCSYPVVMHLPNVYTSARRNTQSLLCLALTPLKN